MQKDPFGHIELSKNKGDLFFTNTVIGLSASDIKREMKFLNSFPNKNDFFFDLTVISELNTIPENLLNQLTGGNISSGKTVPFSLKDLGKLEVKLNTDHVNFDFTHKKPISFDILKENLSTKDLLVISKESLLLNRNLFIKSLSCPTLAISFCNTEFPEEVLFLYDYENTSLNMMKEYIRLFQGQNKRITVLMLSRFQKRSPIIRENILVNFLLDSFEDVGVVVSTQGHLLRDIKKNSNKDVNTLLISGKKSTNLIFKQDIIESLSNSKISYFFEI